jgi:TPP-dependent pyruvate/acetoin dehydrogenase alpha subunit
VANFGKWLVQLNLADSAALERIQSELELEMKKAVEFAVAAPYPAANEVDEDVYA